MIADLFASQTGKLVAVSAGDSLETVMAAYGSGAVARSVRDGAVVMNVDIGGGTSKIAVCMNGKVVDLTAVDVGARLVVTDAAGRINRMEEAGRQFAAELGLKLDLGVTLKPEDARALAGRMAERLFDAMKGSSPKVGASSLLRLDPIAQQAKIAEVTISGGVSEFVYGREESDIRRSGTAAGEGNPRPHRSLGSQARNTERRHSSHRHRCFAIHHAGERQHDFRLADGNPSVAQRAGDRTGHESRSRQYRRQQRRQCHQRRAEAA
jgi:ethanolamine utilization protein EutA